MITEEFKKFIKAAKEKNKDNKEILAVIEDMEKDPQLEQMIGGESENNLRQGRGHN